VAGFPSAHTDNDAQRVRAEDRQCDDHGERHYWNALYRHGSGQLQPTNRWNSRRWTTLARGWNWNCYFGHPDAGADRFPFDQRLSTETARAEAIQSARFRSLVHPVVAADGTVSYTSSSVKQILV